MHPSMPSRKNAIRTIVLLLVPTSIAMLPDLELLIIKNIRPVISIPCQDWLDVRQIHIEASKK
jgi:hypothetical protein